MVFRWWSSSSADAVVNDNESSTPLKDGKEQEEGETVNESKRQAAETAPTTVAATAAAVESLPFQNIPSWTTTPCNNYWQSHRQFCLHFQTLCATSLQVLEHYQERGDDYDFQPPLVSSVVMVTEQNENYDNVGTAVATAFQMKRLQEQQAASTTTDSTTTLTSPSLFQRGFSKAGSALSKIYSYVVDDRDEWKPDHDYHDEQEGDRVDFHDVLLNVELTVPCLESLVQRVPQDEIMLLHVQPNDDNNKSLLQWCRENSAGTLLSRVSHKEALILAHALCHLNVAKFVRHEGTELLAVGATADSQRNVDVAVALLDIENAIQAAEGRLHHYQDRAQAAIRAALAAKRVNHTQQALRHMHTRQLYQTQVEKMQGAILNLETSRHVLQQAQSQQQVLASLQATSKALQTMRTKNNDISVQEVDNVVLDREEQVEELHQVEQALAELTVAAEPNVTGIVDDDDDELWKELEELVSAQHEEKQQTAKAAHGQGASETEETTEAPWPVAPTVAPKAKTPEA